MTLVKPTLAITERITKECVVREMLRSIVYPDASVKRVEVGMADMAGPLRDYCLGMEIS
jgi:hypothetical protein